MNMQALIDGMSAQWQKDRAGTQMTLGQLIAALESMPRDTVIEGGLCGLHSYRGYYCDLALEQTSEVVTAEKLLAMCRAAMGDIFTGYKGGEYQMGKNTPLWVASYGCCGRKLMGIDPATGTVTTADDED